MAQGDLTLPATVTVTVTVTVAEGDGGEQLPEVGEFVDPHPEHGSSQRPAPWQGQDGYREYLYSDLPAARTSS